MKPWGKQATVIKEIEREIPRTLPTVISFECIYSPHHQATILHKGTAYCRSCYDERNRTSELIN